MKTDQFSNQLRWVILLLTAAVILPTVCLLWFMNQAVKNERLAVRQKLIDVYREKTAPLIGYLEQKQVEFEQSLEESMDLEPYFFFRRYCLERENADGVLIRNSEGRIVFPVPNEPVEPTDPSLFEQAWQLEFVDQAYPEAGSEYERVSELNSIPAVVFQGQLAAVRCYEKAGNLEKAVRLCKTLAYPEKNIINEYTASDVTRARLKLVQLYQKLDPDMFESEAKQLLIDLLDGTQHQPLPSEVRVFILDQLLGSMNHTQYIQQHPAEIAKAILIRDAESLSLEILETFDQEQLWDTWSTGQLEAIAPGEIVDGMRFMIDGSNVVFISKRSSTIDVLSYIAQRLSDTAVTVSVFDMHDAAVFGDHKTLSDAFLTLRPGRYFDQWKLCFFFRNDDVFDAAAQRQAGIYIWSGVLSTCLVIGAGALAIRAVNHQIKMNRLKNDFIATVTHELKTPLASMRLLVDTLLEGNYKDEQTATEYLQLVANENKRLTHLIDSFLTFSRMERNKQVFDLASVSPLDIANTAIEAIRPKFDDGKVDFEFHVRKPIPMILADKDGIVTVLVNLLENAYKYTNSDKRIELNIYKQNGDVCFAVKDNGIGLSPRVQRKIFNRFYQGDSRLSRRAEGCGLGLSIVKYIVNAHKGTIEVKSQLNQGSTFTVKLPIMS